MCCTLSILHAYYVLPRCRHAACAQPTCVGVLILQKGCSLKADALPLQQQARTKSFTDQDCTLAEVSRVTGNSCDGDRVEHSGILVGQAFQQDDGINEQAQHSR